MQKFQPLQIANILHITAKNGYQTCLLPELERRAESVAGEFKPQEVSNTLWAYATMGRKPGERLMGLLERRAEVISEDFNSQNVANTLWAYATMGRKPGERLVGLLERRAETIVGEFQVAGVAQMLVWFRFTGRPCLAFLRVPTTTNPEFTSTGKRKPTEVDT
jgi:hypothetical protein